MVGWLSIESDRVERKHPSKTCRSSATRRDEVQHRTERQPGQRLRARSRPFAGVARYGQSRGHRRRDRRSVKGI